MLTNQLSLCVIAVDWSGYPSQEYHVLRASLICDGRSIPLLSWIVPSEKQQNTKVQQAFLNTLFEAVTPKARAIIVTDAGFQNDWFRHIKSLVRDFIGRIRDNIWMRLDSKGEYRFRRQELQACSKPEYLGPGTLVRSKYTRCDGHFYLHKKSRKDAKINAHVENAADNLVSDISGECLATLPANFKTNGAKHHS